MDNPNNGEGRSIDGAATSIEVSVIIPVYNDIDRLTPCIDALAAQVLPQDRFEVIVIDNGPTAGFDDRRATISGMLSGMLHAHVLHEPKPGSYSARNLGLEMAVGRVLAFTDADCVPDPNWLAAGLAYLDEREDAAAAAGSITVFAADPAARTAAELYELRHGFRVGKYIETASFGPTANLFVRRTALLEVGPFDATLMSGGDKEWGCG